MATMAAGSPPAAGTLGDNVRDVSVHTVTLSIPAIENNISNGVLTVSGATEIPSAAV